MQNLQNWLLIGAGLIAVLQYYGVIDVRKLFQGRKDTHSDEENFVIDSDTDFDEYGDDEDLLLGHLVEVRHFISEQSDMPTIIAGLQACNTLTDIIEGGLIPEPTDIVASDDE